MRSYTYETFFPTCAAVAESCVLQYEFHNVSGAHNAPRRSQALQALPSAPRRSQALPSALRRSQALPGASRRSRRSQALPALPGAPMRSWRSQALASVPTRFAVLTTRGVMIFMVGWFAGGTDSHRRWARRQEGIMAKPVKPDP